MKGNKIAINERSNSRFQYCRKKNIIEKHMAAGDGIPIPYLKTKKVPFYSQKKVITT